MHQTLYRKYRPQTFSEVCGQDRITSVLRRQIADETYTHAYLFAGTRGTGKTSCAKIFAKAVNCEHPVDGEPCNECETCKAITEGRLLDVLEIDAASHNGVDDIRDLCEKVDFLPTQCKKRVYIIDEVHMLSPSAFNALLKTLEEPPAHVLFILATTEPGKVLETVRSRCQIFSFSRIETEEITKRVLYVAEQEGIKLPESGARLIARLSDGGMRDALSRLEKCVGYPDELTDSALEYIFELGSQELITSFAVSAAKGDQAACFTLLDDLYRDLGNLKEVLQQVLGAFRDMLLYAAKVPFETHAGRTDTLQARLKAQAEVMSEGEILYQIGVLQDALMQFDRLSVNKKILAELAIVKLCHPDPSKGTLALEARVAALERRFASLSGGFSSSPEDPDPTPAEAGKNAPSADVPSKPKVAAPKQGKPEAKPAARTQADGEIFESAINDALSKSDPSRRALYRILKFRRAGHVLHVYGPPYSIAMFTPRKDAFLAEAQKLDPELNAVELISGEAPANANGGSDTDLDSF